MSALVLDTGALIAVDRDDRTMVARLRVAQRHGLDLLTTAAVIGQGWRGPGGRQANLARFLTSVDVRAVTQVDGRRAGELLGAAGRDDVVDALVVLLAERGDRIMTSDPGDIDHLLSHRPITAQVIPC